MKKIDKEEDCEVEGETSEGWKNKRKRKKKRKREGVPDSVPSWGQKQEVDSLLSLAFKIREGDIEENGWC